jgi:Uma2 family endonuclease
MSIAIATTWEQRMLDLGNVPQDRVRMTPQPGTATLVDLASSRTENGRICELIDGTLVEKAVGWRESLLAGVLLHWLHNYLDQTKLGVATGADGLTRLFDETVRGPDVAFVSWNRLPNGLPEAPYPDLVPNFLIEVLSISNTYGEMSRKRREYFQAGVELLWMVDPRERTVTIYRSIRDFEVVGCGAIISGERILPDWTIDTGKLFAKLDEVSH